MQGYETPSAANPTSTTPIALNAIKVRHCPSNTDPGPSAIRFAWAVPCDETQCPSPELTSQKLSVQKYRCGTRQTKGSLSATDYPQKPKKLRRR